MAKKKTENKEAFNSIDYILGMDVPVWLQKGFIDYIKINNLTFKSEKELEKEYIKFLGE